MLHRSIDKTSEWPQGSTAVKAAFLRKDGAHEGKVMSCRPLRVMSLLYRKWAAMRLDTLKGWTALWASSARYTGIGSQGPDDALHLADMALEDMATRAMPYCGGTADIMDISD